MMTTLTISEVVDQLDTIMDEIEADPGKVVKFSDDEGNHFVLLSVAHYSTLAGLVPQAESSATTGPSSFDADNHSD